MQFDAIKTLDPIFTPLPEYITHPELIYEFSPIYISPSPPTALILIKESNTQPEQISILVPRIDSSISVRDDIFADGEIFSKLVI